MSDTSLIFNLLAVDRASEKIKGVNGAFTKLAFGIAAGAAVIAAKSITAAAAFESSTTRLISSAGETTANINLVRTGMLTMAGQVGDSAMELSRAMYTVESGGFHGAAGLMVLRAAAEGAKTEGADLNVVADATTSVLQDYHLKASDAALVTSQMVAAVGAGKTTFQEFSGSLHSVLPLASSAHISFVDVSAALASMTVHGMSADQASQNLADTIKHLIAPTGVQVKELGQLGMSASDLSGMLGKKGVTGTLQDLSQLILSHMGPSGRVLLSAFNQSKDAAGDVNAMIKVMSPNLQALAKGYQNGSISVYQWRKDLVGLPGPQANLLTQFAALQNQAHGFSNVLKGGGPAAQTYQDALRRVTGDATGMNTALMLTGENTAYVNNAVKTVSKATTEAGNHVAHWSEIQKTFNQKLAEFKAYLGAVTIQIGNQLLPVAKDLLTWTMNSVTWFTKHKTVAHDLAIGIGVLAGTLLVYKAGVLAVTTAHKVATVATVGWKAVQLAFNGVMLAANFVRASAQIVAYVVRVAAAELATRAWMVAQYAMNAALIAGNFVAATAQIVAFAAKQAAIAIATKAWAAAQWLLNIAMDANPIGIVIAAVALLAAGIYLLWTHSTTFRKIMIATWTDVWNFLKMIGRWFAGPFAGFFVAGYHIVVNGVTTAVNWVHSKWSSVINFFSSIPGKISSIASRMWTGIGTAFRGMINWIIDIWNRLNFTIPKVSFLGMSLGGGTIGVPHINHLAGGGDITRGGVAMVGERGPEPVYLPTGASVAPHSSLKSAMGGTTTVVFDVRGADTEFGRLLMKILRTQPGTATSAARVLRNT
jgi:TP901 family phage tail tape measure protein